MEQNPRVNYVENICYHSRSQGCFKDKAFHRLPSVEAVDFYLKLKDNFHDGRIVNKFACQSFFLLFDFIKDRDACEMAVRVDVGNVMCFRAEQDIMPGQQQREGRRYER